MCGGEWTEAGAGIIKGLELTVLCPQSFCSMLLSMMQEEKMIESLFAVGRLMTKRALNRVCARSFLDLFF